MAAQQLPEKFQVAFSFAGEQRELVRSIALELEAQLGESKVFFDEWWEHYLAGDDADLKLQAIYSTADVVVVCVSQPYGAKAWTTAEHAAIRARRMSAQAAGAEAEKLGILPIRVGDGDVPGVLFNTIVPDIRDRTPGDAAALVLDRLRLVGGTVGPDHTPAGPGDRHTHRVQHGEWIDQIADRYLGEPTQWRQLAVANQITDPLAVRPGDMLVIPELDHDE